MGLAERRKIKELQEATLPDRVREIEEIRGKAIPYEVDWESLADGAEGLNFLDNISCHRLNMALRTICMDEMGKDAVRQTVLEMHCAYALRTDGMFSDGEIRELLLKYL